MGHGLERILSKAGVCSRQRARVLIAAGRVRVNGRVARDPEAFCDPARDDVLVDGVRLRSVSKIHIALHKPRGVVTTRSDPEGRPTVYTLLADVDAWVVPVGRLDLESSGLLVFTNDTAFMDLITSPESHVEKTYLVEARPRLSDAALEELRRGVELDDGPTRPAIVEKRADFGPNTRFLITITEGRNRQIRRMVKAVGSKVMRLHRTRIGQLELGRLAPGAWRTLTAAEVAALARAARRRARK